MKGNVSFEEKVQLNIQKAFDVTAQWLRSQHKAKIKKSQPPSFIENSSKFLRFRLESNIN